jgi:glutaredoxin
MTKITIYSKELCPFCVRAIKLAEAQQLTIEEVKLGKDLPRDEFLKVLTTKIGKTPEKVPQIFLGEGEQEQHIGGFTELAQHFGVDPDAYDD